MSFNKPIDDGIGPWLRRMTWKSIFRRFGFAQSELDWSNDNRKTLPGMPSCPVCSGATAAKRESFKNNLKKDVVVYFPQCIENWAEDRHGYGNRSPFGTRSKVGRKPEGDEDEVEAPKPPPKVDAPKPPPPPKVNHEGIPDIGEVVHSQVARAFKYVMNGARNLYFTGPAGTGKSHASEQLLRLLKAASPERWGSAPNAAVLTVGLGTMNSQVEGIISRFKNEGEYLPSVFVASARQAGVTIVEEADKGNPNLAGFWNLPLANFKIPTPGGVFERHPDSIVIFVGNTTGHAPSKQYAGSVRQDFATLDRFRIFNVGYERAVEFAAIPGLDSPTWEYFQTVRIKAEKAGFQRILGTRYLGRLVQTMRIENLSAQKALSVMADDEGWSSDEKLAVL
jgi:hypothetical protein